MTAAARVRLARMLRGDVESTFSVELTARPDALDLEVEGFGPVKFPVTPAKARKLIEHGQPARFGQGTETVTDPEVRDTWEIPRRLVHAKWKGARLRDLLTTVKEELGLPNGAVLTADLHSLLVYEPGQFFLSHQDSEKRDGMVGTLVVTLPSRYRGGELTVGTDEKRTSYRGSAADLSLVAFYADCRHEVLPVQSGYRIALTYNLLMHGDTSQPTGERGKIAELETLLREHFSTPARRYNLEKAPTRPDRLVYLLDHEYTPRALHWTRLKGADATRVALLRTAAWRAGCESILALAKVKTTHAAYAEDDRRHRDDDEHEGRADAAGRTFDISDEVTTPEVTLTHWTGPDGSRLDQISLPVSEHVVCASTENGDLVPYSSEYEGYMGNWGNTLDRWYHRAVVVVWPRADPFANRGQASPSWALDELAAMALAGDTAGVRRAAAVLRPLWADAVRGLSAAGDDPMRELAGDALRTAVAVADREIATLLLRPFRVENLTEGQAGRLAALVVTYGHEWTAGLVQTWFADGPSAWPAGRDRSSWLADQMRGLCQALDAEGGSAGSTARLLLDRGWAWLRKDIDYCLHDSSPSFRDSMLGRRAKPLAAVLTTAAGLGSASVADAVSKHLRQLGDAVIALELATLRTVTETAEGQQPAGGDAGFRDLAADCAARLRAQVASRARADGDWVIDLSGSCDCELCATLTAFLSDARRRTFEWPLGKDQRQHIHSRLDRAEVPVTHVTKRHGDPYTLVLTKSGALLDSARKAQAAAEADLAWLAARWSPESPPSAPS